MFQLQVESNVSAARPSKKSTALPIMRICLCRLVRFRTVNQIVTDTEKECQLFVARIMEAIKLETDLFSPEDVPYFREHPAYFPGKDYSDKPNVVGRLQGRGNGRSLVFSSHVDTTVVAPGWTKDPWEAQIEDNRLYGLGSFDMKGGLAASIMALRCLIELGVKLKGDVFIESVVNEEFGGANGTLACRLRGYNPAAIIPEPTNMVICPASRGGAQWRVTFRGTTGMSFSGEKIENPVYAAGKFISFLEEYEQKRNSRTGTVHWYETDASLPVMITRVEAGDMTVPLNDTGPAECIVDVWVECHPGMTEEKLKQEVLEGFAEKLGVPELTGTLLPDISKLIRFLPGSEVAPEFP